MYQPKALSAMGFRSLDEFNQALIAKQCWKLLHQSYSWTTQVLKARYNQNRSFWKLRVGKNPSYLWMFLFWGHEVLDNGCIWQVDDESKLWIFEDIWLPQHGSLHLLSPRPYHGVERVNELLTRWGFGIFSLFDPF